MSEWTDSLLDFIPKLVIVALYVSLLADRLMLRGAPKSGALAMPRSKAVPGSPQAIKETAYGAIAAGSFLAPIPVLLCPELHEMLSPLPSPGAWIGVAVAVVGRGFTLAGAFQLGASKERHRLQETGVFGLTRNPMTIGLTLVFVGAAIAVPSKILPFALVPWALHRHFRINAEERHLTSRLGARFASYCRRVPRYLIV